MTYKLLQGDCLETLKTLEAGSVQTCVTSPPYFGLRDYQTATWEGGDPECDHTYQKGGRNPETSAKQVSNAGTTYSQYEKVCKRCGALRVDDQIGLEETPEIYVEKLVQVFREVRRVLKDDGTLWIVIGDSYAGSGKGTGDTKSNNKSNGASRGVKIGSVHGESGHTSGVTPPIGYKPKDLLMIPARVAIALQADGWYLRSDCIWHKPNPMPESVTDRPTKSHEYIFLLSKSSNYFYDAEAILEPANYDGSKDTKFKGSEKYKDSGQTFAKQGHERWSRTMKNLQPDGQQPNTMHLRRADGLPDTEYPARNKRSVWTISTKPYKEAHFATFPPDLIEPCILAGTSEKGECPKCGRAWVRATETYDEPKTKMSGSKKYPSINHNLGINADVYKRNKTLGWQPQCGCWEYAPDLPIIDGVGFKQPYEPVPQTVLDPFNGSGTTGAVAIKHHRNYIGCELNPEYIELTKRRLSRVQYVLFEANP